MALRKATGNQYEFITHIWNPVKGRHGYGCSHCCVKRSLLAECGHGAGVA